MNGQRPALRSTLRALRRWVLPVVVGLLGATIGILLTPATTVAVGPLTASVHLRPALEGRTELLLPPVGEVYFDTHTAPVVVEARIRSVDLDGARQLLDDDDALAQIQRTAPDAVTSAALRNAGLNALLATLGAAGAVGLTYRRVRRSVVAGATALGVAAASCGLVVGTFRPQALYQPQFEGLLSQAAYVADFSYTTTADYASYRATLADFVGQVSALYIAADSLPAGIAADQDLITVMHVSDIHDNPQAFDVIDRLSGQFGVDAVVDTGDIVSWGTSWEDNQLAAIGRLDVPYVFVSGNHDGAGAVAVVAAQPNAVVLNNQVTDVAGLRIAGIGDPRFAADDDSDAGGFTQGKEAVAATTTQLGDTVEEYDAAHPDAPVDVALVHDPSQPKGLEGRVPLVLSGHMHASKIELDRDGSGTDWLTVGSTGGALASGGVRPVADGGDPLDLSARMLYFDADTHRLLAYDDITLGGLGLVSVSIQRHQLPAEEAPLSVPEDATEPATDPAAPSISPGQTVPDDQRVTPDAIGSAAPTDQPLPGSREQPATSTP